MVPLFHCSQEGYDMGTITNGGPVVPNRKVQVKVISEAPTSSILGNTYLGQKHTLNINTAIRLVKHGLVEFVDPEDALAAGVDPDAAPAEPVKEQESESDDNDADDAESEALTLEDALKRLDPDDDAHWTKTGLPDCNVLKELTGTAVTRQEVNDVAPDFNREQAAENAE